jgi:hypothetical protein
MQSVNLGKDLLEIKSNLERLEDENANIFANVSLYQNKSHFILYKIKIKLNKINVFI